MLEHWMIMVRAIKEFDLISKKNIVPPFQNDISIQLSIEIHEHQKGIEWHEEIADKYSMSA